MSIKLTTQGEWRSARDRVEKGYLDPASRRRQRGFCYLCGERMDIRLGECSREHIIPRQLLGVPKNASSWPPVLKVHRACDAKFKKPNDDLFEMLRRLSTSNPEQWHPRALGELAKLMTKAEFDDFGYRAPVMDGTPAMRAVRAWIGGFYAALYSQPACFTHFVSAAPWPLVPTDAERRLEDRLFEERVFAERIARLFQYAESNGGFDEVSAWSGSVNFRCFWPRVSSGKVKSYCCYRLEFPGLLEMSQKVRALPIPFLGMFGRAMSAPRGATMLTIPAISK